MYTIIQGNHIKLLTATYDVENEFVESLDRIRFVQFMKFILKQIINLQVNQFVLFAYNVC